MFSLKLAFALAAISLTLAHPIHSVERRSEYKIVGRTSSSIYRRAEGNGLEALSTGNQEFRDELKTQDPNLLTDLTDKGQAPPFMFLGCSDSRVSEGTIFKAKPGTLFTERNIANQFTSTDPNAHSILSYAVAELGVEHVIVMGHYGCGGVAASIASRPTDQLDAANGAIQNWIEPIRQLFLTSNRQEIVDLRTKVAGQAVIEEPEVSDPGFRALVEENVKRSVSNIAADTVITNHYASLNGTANGAAAEKRAEGEAPKNVFIHGFVYDIATGVISDLGVSVSPPGVEIPAIPFATIVKAAESSTGSAELEADLKAGSAEPEANSKAGSAELEGANLKAGSVEPEANSKPGSAEPEADSKASSVEPEANSKPGSAEPEANSTAEPEANSKTGSENTLLTRCVENCKAKRGLFNGLM